MKRKVLLFSLCLLACLANSYAEKATSIDKDNTEKTTEEEPKKKSRLTLGGYEHSFNSVSGLLLFSSLPVLWTS